jgi:hypothetical protein
MKIQYTIKTVQLVEKGKEAFVTYFYKKGNSLVVKSICDGTRCGFQTRETLGLDGEGYTFSSRLPKYIEENSTNILEAGDDALLADVLKIIDRLKLSIERLEKTVLSGCWDAGYLKNCDDQIESFKKQIRKLKLEYNIV